jgi:hypothetical protein
MSEERGTLRLIAEHLVGAVAPLHFAFRDADSFRTLMGRLGWDALDLPPVYATTADKAQAAVEAIEALADDADLAAIFAVIRKVGDVYGAINALSVAPPGVAAGEFLSEIGRRLFEYLLLEYLRSRLPRLLMSLEAIGVVAYENKPPANGGPGYTRHRFDWEAIPERLSDVPAIAADVYGWGADQLNFAKIVEIFSELCTALDLLVSIDHVGKELGDAYQALAAAPPKESIGLAFTAALFEIAVNDELYDVGFRMLELPAEGSALPGLIVQPTAPQGLAERVEVAPNWVLNVRAGTDLAHQFGIVLRPDEIAVRYPFAPGATLPSAGFGVALAYEGGEPFRLFGNPQGIRLEGKNAKFFADLDLKQGQLELKAGIAPEDLTLVLTAADLDGFLGSVLGGLEARIAFPLGLSWSNRTGLSFVSGLGFEVSSYPHLDSRFVRFERVDLGLRFISGAGEPPQLDFRVANAFSGSLGPISYTIDRLGVHLPITLQPGNVGPFDIGFGIFLPTAIGLVIDSGAVTGGGFIKRDPDAGRYCGMLELEMFDIAVAATGVLDTKDAAGARLPPPGYSFFISISAEFSPIQLGYGFTLNGVGGLAGVHRRMDVDAILSRMREGVLDSIMFPKDPVANAAVIISNLTTIFPIAMNRYVFGPMAIIGWGTPNLVKVELGVVLELPSPIVLALLGKASIAIPAEDEPVISINLDFVGVLDYGRSLFAVDAALRDSYVAAFAIQGDMAMRLTWAGKRNVAMAIGGLHPHFAPPPGFPTLRRVTVALGNGDNPRITLEGYYALTSNSRQFGARAELYAEAAGCSVHGWLGFDALFTIRPLWFRIDFEAGMTLNRGSRRIAGITVRGSLTGPSPFHVWGEGCISILFFDVCVPFDKTFGLPRIFDLPGKDPWLVLEAAIKSVGNWAVELDKGVTTAATMRAPPPGAAPLLLHPMGAATLRQRVLPLNRLLERFGEFDIVGPNRFDVAGVKVGQNGAPDWTIASDDFAPGDFEALSETERLSRDSFESMAAGVSVCGNFVLAPQDRMKVAKVTYETRIIDAPWETRVLPSFTLSRAVQLFTGLRGAKALSRFTRGGRGKFARDVTRAAGVTLKPETYAVATVDRLARRADVAAQATRGAAYLAVKTKVGRGAQASGVQVVPSHELEIAA